MASVALQYCYYRFKELSILELKIGWYMKSAAPKTAQTGFCLSEKFCQEKIVHYTIKKQTNHILHSVQQQQQCQSSFSSSWIIL